MTHLLPNDPIGVPVQDADGVPRAWLEATVVASVVYNDDDSLVQTLLLMHRESPFFQVAIYDHGKGMAEATLSARILNIVPAVEQYQEWGGDY